MTKVASRTPRLPRLKSHRRQLYLAILASSQLLSPAAFAGPQGGNIVGGTGSIEQTDLTTTITQQTDRLAINWDSFNVGADERVSFIQPGASSIALNRIMGNNGSEILGQVDANGHVVLVNPHGIFFGETATVNVGGLIASGLDINPQDFMNGDFSFAGLEGTEGTVINSGLIQAATGGSVTLLGKQVKNDGLIMANLGTVSLAAGNAAVLTFDASGMMGVQVTEAVLQEELGVDPALLNDGDIQAAGGRILLTASTSRDIFSRAVNAGDMAGPRSVVVHDDGSFTLGGGADVVNTGRLDVSSMETNAGDIALIGENVTNSGNILADSHTGNAGHIEVHAAHTALLTENSRTSARAETGSQGGQIKVLGHHVGLFDQAEVDASGALGGGQVYIGGDYQGNNPYLPNAYRTYVGADAAIYADALTAGDGGRVIVWADDVTRFYGNLYGRGAGQAGRGGFAEVSGKEHLHFDGYATLSGPAAAGHLLLDPTNIIIDADGTDVVPEVPGEPGDPRTYPFSDGGDVNISSAHIRGILNGNTSVTLQATQNITVGHNILAGDANSDTTLTLEAGNNITVNASINLGAGNMRFIAGHLDCGGTGCILDPSEGRSFTLTDNGALNTTGNIHIAAARDITIDGLIGNTSRPSLVNLQAGNNIEISGNITTELRNIADILDPEDRHQDTLILTAGQQPLDAFGDATIYWDEDTAVGDILISGELHTHGGGFNAQGAGAFDAIEGLIDTGTTRGAGNITISAEDEVSLGSMSISYTDYGGVNDHGATHISTIDVHSDADVTLYRPFDFNDSGPREDVSGEAKGVNHSAALVLTANGNIIFHEDAISNDPIPNSDADSINNAIIYDLYGDARDTLNITLIADANNDGFGSVDLRGDIYTSGGNFEASGQNVTLGGMVNTDHANNLMDGDPDPMGDDDWYRYGIANWSNGGDVTIKASETIELSTIITDATCFEIVVCTGNLTLARREEGDAVSISQAEDTQLIVAGSTTLEAGTGSITLANNNEFSGPIRIVSARDVSLTNTSTDHDTIIGESSIANNFTLTSASAIRDITPDPFGDETSHIISVGGLVTLDSNNELIDWGNHSHLFSDFAAIEARGADITLNAAGNLTIASINASGHASGDRGGNINIMAAGDITVASDVISAGRAYSAQDPYTTINLDAGGSLTLGNINAEGGAANQTGAAIALNAGIGDLIAGNLNSTSVSYFGAPIDVSAGGSVTLGNIFTNGRNDDVDGRTISITAGDSVTVGNITGSGNDRRGRNVLIDAQVGTITAGNIIVNGAGIRGAGNVNLTAGDTISIENINATGGNNSLGGVIDIESSQSISVGDIFANGGSNGQGGTISLTAANSISVGALTTNAGSRDGNVAGQNAGNITLDSTSITLEGNLSASGTRGGTGGGAEGRANGASGIISLAGTIHLAAPDDGAITIDTRLQEGPSTQPTSEGRVNLTGDIESSNASGLTIHTANANIQGSIGSEAAIGSLAITAYASSNAVIEPVINITGDINAANATLRLEADINGLIDLQNDQFFSTNVALEATGDGIHNFNAPNVAGFWETTGNNQGRLSGTSDFSTSVITFSDFSTLRGSEYNDSFTIGHDINQVMGVAGDNQFQFLAGGRVTLLDGGTGTNNTLIGRDATANTWNITGANQGNLAPSYNDSYVIQFQNIQTLQAGSASDTFNIDASIGTLLGGSGGDSFIFGSEGAAAVVNGGSGSGNRVVGREESTNTWAVTSDHTGNLSVTDGSLYVGEFTQIQILEAGNEGDRFDINGEIDTLTGGTGDDLFYFLENGAATLVSGGEGHNTLFGRNSNNVWTLSAANTGILARRIDEETTENYISEFTAIHALVGGTHDDIFSVSGNENVAVTIDGGASGSNQLDITGANLALLVQMGAPSEEANALNISNIQHLAGNELSTLAISHGGNNWTLTDIDEGTVGTEDASSPLTTPLSFSGIPNLLGGSDNDQFFFNAPDTQGAVSGWINGNGGNNTLHGRNQPNVWTIDGENTGILAQVIDVDLSSIYVDRFLNIQNLVGGTSSDTFSFGDSGDIGSADGNGGYNTLDLQARNAFVEITLFAQEEDLFGVSDIQSIQGNSHIDSWLRISDGRNDWTIDQLNSGEISSLRNPEDENPVVINFSGFTNLGGGTGNDTFTLEGEGNVTTLEGGGGHNTLNTGAQNSQWVLDGTHQGELHYTYFDVDTELNTEYSLGFEGIQTLGGSGTDSVTGANQSNDWQITDNGAGYVVLTGEPVDQRTHFTGMAELIGNTNTDVFTFTGNGQVSSVSGAGGENTLGAETTENQWELLAAHQGTVALGSIDRTVTFDGIQTLTGSGADSLTGANQSNDWQVTDSGAGYAVLTGALENQRTHFTGMAELIGNTNTDVFTFTGNGQVSSVSGAGGDNTLSAETTENQWELLAAHEGTVALGSIDRTVTFDGIQTLTGSGDDSLTGANQSNDWQVTDSGAGYVVLTGALENQRTHFTGMADLIGNTITDVFTFTGNGQVGSVSGAGGENTLSTETTENQWALTGAHQGTVTLGGIEQTVTFDGIQTLAGSGDDDSLTGANQSNDWQITGNGTGYVVLTGALEDQRTHFTGMTGVIGNTNNDDFTLTSNGIISEIDGGAGGTNTLYGRNSNNRWNITGENSGNVVDVGLTPNEAYVGQFNRINRLIGGTGNDTFVFGDNGSIDYASGGVQGAVTLNYANRTNDITVVVAEGAIDNVIGVSAIIGNHNAEGSPNSTLQAQSGDNTWSIDNVNAGEADFEGIGTVTFSGFNHLYGGAGSDVFTLIGSGAVTGSLTGGSDGGNQIILHRDLTSDVTWTIEDSEQESSHFVYDGISTRFSGIQILTGSNTHKDTFVINHLTAITVDGGADADNELNLKGIQQSIDIALGSEQPIGGFLTVNNINELNANDSFINNLIGYQGGSEWIITGQNQGAVNDQNSEGRIRFSGFSILSGADNARDIFRFEDNGAITTRIEGGTFNDSEHANLLYGRNDHSDWIIDGLNTGSLALTDGPEYLNRFEGMGQLVGGAGDDLFVFSGDQAMISHGIYGGDSTGYDLLDLRETGAAWVVAVEADVEQALSIYGIDEVIANATTDNRLLANGSANEWLINDTNAGELNSMLFSGFSQLIGGEAEDSFEFTQGGSITGYLDAGTGGGSLDLTALNTHVSVAVNGDDSSGAQLNIFNFFSIDANADDTLSNTLVAYGDVPNNWAVTGPDRGLWNDALAFNGFSNLVGGVNDDTFTFAPAGALRGYIDGGARGTQGNTVNLSGLQQVDVSLGNSGSHWRNIDLIVGNNSNSRLRGANAENIWTLSQGQNQGVVVSTEQGASTQFEGFTHLVGGANNDRFVVNNGSVTGSITGGAGLDSTNHLELTLTNNPSGSLTFRGGENAHNSLAITGGSLAMDANHRWTGAGEGRLTYSQGVNSFGLELEAISQIQDNLTAGTLTIEAASGSNSLVLSQQAYSLHGYTVGYQNKHNLTVLGTDTGIDTVTISGQVALNGSVQIDAARLLAEPNSLLVANELRLENTGNIGSSGARVNLAVNQLWLDSINGAVYLNGQGGITISRFRNISAPFNLILDGTLASNTALSSAESVTITSHNGDITLLNTDNYLSGELGLHAQRGRVGVYNQGGTDLGGITTQYLDITSTGAITAPGRVIVSRETSLSSGGRIDMQNANNLLRQVTVEQANNVNLRSSEAITLDGVNASGGVSIVSNGFSIIGQVNATDLTVNADANPGTENNRALIDSAINVADRVSIIAQGIRVNNGITANDIHLDGKSGDVRILASLNAQGGQGIYVSGHSIDQQAVLTSGGAVDILATADIAQAANITSSGTVNLTSGGGIQVGGIATTTADQVIYLASGDIYSQTINADNGIMVTSTAGAIVQQGELFANSGMLSLHASGNISVNALMDAQDVQITSDVGDLIQNNRIRSSNGVSIDIGGHVSAHEISAQTDILLAAGETMRIEEALTSHAGSIVLESAESLTQNAHLSAQSVSVTSSVGSIEQQAGVYTTNGNIQLNAGADIVMSESTQSISENGGIRYAAGRDITVSMLSAVNGTANIEARSGSISQLNQTQPSIEARRLEMRANSGIRVSTQVSELALNNNTGSVAFTNNQDISIDHFRNNSNASIDITQGNLIFNNHSGAPFSFSESDANLAGGNTNVNYNIGSLTIRVLDGSVLASGQADLNRPDVIARDASITALRGDIGSPARPLVVLVRDSVFIQGFRSWPPVWGLNRRPERIENASSLQMSIMDLLGTGNQQMVEVETLEEINPAIFTDVRNYFFDEVSILLPRDQRYEDDEGY